MEPIEEQFEDKTNSGFRFFRDDALIEEYNELKKCSRCYRWYWPDESVQKSTIQEGICGKCHALLSSRIRSLSQDHRYCPADPQDYIFTKKYHNCGGRGRPQAFKKIEWQFEMKFEMIKEDAGRVVTVDWRKIPDETLKRIL